MTLREIVAEIEATGRLPLAVAIEPRLLREAWWTAHDWIPLYGLAHAVGREVAVALAIPRNVWGDCPRTAETCDAIRAAVPCPSVAEIAAALAARAA